MIVRIDPQLSPAHELVTAMPGAVQVEGRVSRVFVYAGPQLCLMGEDQRELLRELARRRITLPISRAGLSHFLHHGFVPAPHTVRTGLYRLSAGDTLTVRPGLDYEAAYRCRWRNADSREDSVPSTDHLLELLSAAVLRSLDRAPATLMLSSGKDSVALALACREAGRTDVQTVTFTNTRGGEATDAAAFAARLGLQHRTVVLPTDAGRIEESLHRCFAASSEPCGDPTLIPYLLAAGEAELVPGSCLIDGLNNDSWVGYAPGRAEVRGSRIADRWLAWLRPLRGLAPPQSRWSAALRSRAEWHFFGGRWLRHADTRRFFSGSTPTHQYWLHESRRLRQLDDFDFRAEVRGRHADQNAMIVKGYVTGETLGLRTVFPFTDAALADWYFNLPEADRFDRAALMNKVSLRRLLRERLDYDDQRLGKRVFEFDGAGFLSSHRTLVEHEIRACRWWTAAASATVADLIHRPAALDKTWPAVLALFQLSGWLNQHAPDPEEP